MKPTPVAFVAVLSFVTLLPFCGGGIDRPSIESVSSDSVSYQTADGVRIVAGWFLPPGKANPPVVILLHEENGTRAQWNGLIPILVDNGYAVLAPDLRGFGESNTVVRDGQEQPYEFTNRLEPLLDVDAAIEWLKKQSEIDLGYLAVIGSRLGADLAYVSTGAFPEVRRAVAITPSSFTPDDPLFKILPDFAAHDIFFMAGGRREWEAAASLGIRVQNIGGDRYEDHSDLDGVALLTIDKPVRDILDWLKRGIESPVPTTTVR